MQNHFVKFRFLFHEELSFRQTQQPWWCDITVPGLLRIISVDEIPNQSKVSLTNSAFSRSDSKSAFKTHGEFMFISFNFIWWKSEFPKLVAVHVKVIMDEVTTYEDWASIIFEQIVKNQENVNVNLKLTTNVCTWNNRVSVAKFIHLSVEFSAGLWTLTPPFEKV